MGRILKICNFFLGCIVLFVIACGDDSSSASDALSENQSSSSSWIASNSSSSRNDVKNSSSSISVKSSSSSAKRLSGEVSGDPLQIFKTRVPKKAVYHCDLTQEISGLEGDFDQKDWICSFKYAGMEGYVYVQSSPTGCTPHWGFYPDICPKARQWSCRRVFRISYPTYNRVPHRPARNRILSTKMPRVRTPRP